MGVCVRACVCVCVCVCVYLNERERERELGLHLTDLYDEEPKGKRGKLMYAHSS